MRVLKNSEIAHFVCTIYLWSEQQQALVAEAEAVIVCVDKTNMQKTLIPELVRQKLKEFELTVGHQI